MNNLLKAEFYKLTHNRSFWGILLFTLVLGSVLLLDSRNLTSSILKGSLYNTSLLYFLIIIFAVFFIGEDFEKRTLYCFISAGHKRSSILFAKMLSYLTACILILIIPLVFHGLIEVVISGGNIPLLADGLRNIIVVLSAILAMGMLPLLFAFVF